MNRYLVYRTNNFERFKTKNHELIGSTYAHDIDNASLDIQKWVKDEMEGDENFHDCRIAADYPVLLNTLNTSDAIAYDFMICGIAYPNYPAEKNLVVYFGILEVTG